MEALRGPWSRRAAPLTEIIHRGLHGWPSAAALRWAATKNEEPRRREDRSEAGGAKTGREEGAGRPGGRTRAWPACKAATIGRAGTASAWTRIGTNECPPTKKTQRFNMDEQDGKQIRTYPVYPVHRCSISSPFPPPPRPGPGRGGGLRIFPASPRLCASHLPPEICAACEDSDGLWHGCVGQGVFYEQTPRTGRRAPCEEGEILSALNYPCDPCNPRFS
jgi:hypothetical protein